VKIVDCFTDVILYARKLARGDIQAESADEARNKLVSLFDQSRALCDENGLTGEIFLDAKYPVVAFVDELFLTSEWSFKNDWKSNPLQRVYFNTTNAGAGYYDRLALLNKFGPDKDVREVYALTLGLGFRGMYFRGEDRQHYEEIKAFNMGLLLPEDAQQDIESAILFPLAYREHSAERESSFKPRLNIYPVLIGVPLTIVVVLSVYFHFDIASTLNHIQQLIKY